MRALMTVAALALSTALAHAQATPTPAPGAAPPAGAPRAQAPATAPATPAKPMAAAKPAPAPAKTLFERLGGEPAIKVVVDDFVANVAADKRINKFFASTNPQQMDRLKKLLVEQICQASGGPCKYTGRDMKTTHAGMGVTNAHFDALVGDLKKALIKHKVKAKEQKELLALLAPMRKDIVEPPKKATPKPKTT